MVKVPYIHALESALLAQRQPVVTGFSLFVLAHRLYAEGRIFKQRLPLDKAKLAQTIAQLREQRFIRSDPDFKTGVYRVSDLPDGTTEEICALIDPFCYISHLSAMRRHGLTDRLSAVLTVTSPGPSLWKALCTSYEQHILGTTAAPAHLKRMHFPARIRQQQVTRHQTVHVGASQSIRDSFSRIATIGTAFTDMLERPGLCGGMSHVIETWQAHATLYHAEIVQAVNAHTQSIVKVRAGYLLDEMLQLSTPSEWLQYVQRGGSRRLDPDRDYASRYSQKWMLSLNA